MQEALKSCSDDTFSPLDNKTTAALQIGFREPGIRGLEVPCLPTVDLLGQSPPMLALRAMMQRVAPTRAHVLLIGESGTGKEVVAQSIHRHSRQSSQPFVAINCGAIPPSLIEAELFGHERGSFTGAHRSHKGVFERAAGGTLFLDEITEMPLDMQVKLLRVLESNRFYRVGGDQELIADCRIIAATNREPEHAVQDGMLRADLLYRLAVFPLRIPPLREREADIEMLAKRFLADLNALDRQTKRLSAASSRFLLSHPWPGNVRELKNSVQRAFILADDELDLVAATLPTAYARSASSFDSISVRIGVPLAEVERALILATMERCDGNKRHAAKVLGVSLKTLYNRLNEYHTFARSPEERAPAAEAACVFN
jgi:DNA-binding NtrC family response regulator